MVWNPGYYRSRLESSKTNPSLSEQLAAYRKAVEGAGSGELRSELYVSSLIEDPAVEILMAAAASFQELETGRTWLLTPNPSLGNRPPLMLITTPEGRKMVLNELGLIEHGMF